MADEGRIALTILEAAAMAFWSILMLELIEDSYEEFLIASDELEEAMHQQISMAQTLHGHTIGVTHAFLQRAMQEAFDYPIDDVEYAAICAKTNDIISRTGARAVDAERFYHNSFCSSYRRSGQQGHAAGIAAVDSAFARTRSQERRKERQQQARIGVIQRTHTGTFRNPQAAFGLIDNAVQLYSGLQAGALQTLGGNLATFGATISQFASKVADIADYNSGSSFGSDQLGQLG